MPNKFIVLILILLVKHISSHSEVVQACINRPTNRENLNNDVLLGQWYVIIHFNPAFSFKWDGCKALNFSKPSNEEVLKYKAKYTNQSAPYNIDDNPVLVTDGSKLLDGMIMGHKRAKFYVMNPQSAIVVSGGFRALVYRPINDKFILSYGCSFRRNMIDLLSREKHPNEDELEAAIARVRDLKRLKRERFCAPKVVEQYDIEL